MEQKIKKLVTATLKELKHKGKGLSFVVEHPEDLEHGDYSTNVAMVYAKHLKEKPHELAVKIKNALHKNLPEEIKEVEVAGPGFINFRLSHKFFAGSLEEILNDKNFGGNKTLKGKKIMVEYTDPNPFKPFHIGHLMTNAIGESIARILESSGASVSRANYQGDVGLHVAKAIWGLKNDPKLQDRADSIAIQSRNIGLAYADGAEAYENGKEKEIDEINLKIYDKSDSEINAIYEWGFKVTMDAFQDLYEMLGTEFDYYFLESVMADIGRGIVNENKGKVFEDSDGAVVFHAEKYDPKLHTRVFITSNNLPTYETKELGLTEEKFKTVPDLDQSIVITANEQADYMRVVMKALSLINPEHEKKMMHITHGMMRFADGKMGSRKGNVITGESLIEEVRNRARGDVKVAIGAIKYMILHQATGGDIIFDLEKSVSTEGDSGVYLQYSYARANSVIEKAKKENILPAFTHALAKTTEVEKMLYRFPEVVARAAAEYEPHYIANYLIELARSYNSFYGNTVIVDKKDEHSPYKVALSFAFAFVMKRGLHLLGIEAPEKM